MGADAEPIWTRASVRSVYSRRLNGKEGNNEVGIVGNGPRNQLMIGSLLTHEELSEGVNLIPLVPSTPPSPSPGEEVEKIVTLSSDEEVETKEEEDKAVHIPTVTADDKANRRSSAFGDNETVSVPWSRSVEGVKRAPAPPPPPRKSVRKKVPPNRFSEIRPSHSNNSRTGNKRDLPVGRKSTSNQEQIICQYCGRKMMTMNALAMHIQKKHLPNRCHACGNERCTCRTYAETVRRSSRPSPVQYSTASSVPASQNQSSSQEQSQATQSTSNGVATSMIPPMQRIPNPMLFHGYFVPPNGIPIPRNVIPTVVPPPQYFSPQVYMPPQQTMQQVCNRDVILDKGQYVMRYHQSLWKRH